MTVKIRSRGTMLSFLQAILKLPKAEVAGAANRIRTCDPVITNDVLYQLSYCGGPSGAFGNGAENARP
jgi:hypothetical protein